MHSRCAISLYRSIYRPYRLKYNVRILRFIRSFRVFIRYIAIRLFVSNHVSDPVCDYALIILLYCLPPCFPRTHLRLQRSVFRNACKYTFALRAIDPRFIRFAFSPQYAHLFYFCTLQTAAQRALTATIVRRAANPSPCPRRPRSC